MKSCAIALMCLYILAGLPSLCQADLAAQAAAGSVRVVQREQVTILVEDVMHNLLGYRTFAYDATSPCGPPLPGPMSLWFTLSYDSQPAKSLFGDIPLLQNVGKTFWISSSCADPGYRTFLTSLTDGRNERLSGIFTAESLLGTFSSYTTRVYESGFTPGGSGDFKGNRIGRIGIRIDAASIDQIPCNVEVVPEPGAASVFLVAIGGYVGFWRRRKRR